VSLSRPFKPSKNERTRLQDANAELRARVERLEQLLRDPR
jgi:hypothetical protein